uniref:Uncharacterized protein n=1 Tax=Glossina pallidipes TaxID=7398 RepID=A0A1A9ZFN9_GLOPL
MLNAYDAYIIDSKIRSDLTQYGGISTDMVNMGGLTVSYLLSVDIIIIERIERDREGIINFPTITVFANEHNDKTKFQGFKYSALPSAAKKLFAYKLINTLTHCCLMKSSKKFYIHNSYQLKNIPFYTLWSRQRNTEAIDNMESSV